MLFFFPFDKWGKVVGEAGNDPFLKDLFMPAKDFSLV